MLELTSVVAGPSVGKYLADLGADVIKVDPPGGDGTTRMGWLDPRDGVSLFYKLVNRGKRSVILDLKSSDGRTEFLRLADDADVLVENMRPGRLEALGLPPSVLHERNGKLVVVRLTGFGQTGPLADSPGFATTAEALGGLAALMGEPSGGPSLPPIAVTDEIAGLVGAFSALAAVHYARTHGQGQVVDVNLLDSLIQILGPLPTAWASLGYLQPRLGASLPYSVPRGVYRTADMQWVAVSASADSVAERLMRLLGLTDPRMLTFTGRYEARVEIETRLVSWMEERTLVEVVESLTKADVAVAPVLNMEQVVNHPHMRARQTFISVDGLVMQGPVARLSLTPGSVRHAGTVQVDGVANWASESEPLDEADSSRSASAGVGSNGIVSGD